MEFIKSLEFLKYMEFLKYIDLTEYIEYIAAFCSFAAVLFLGYQISSLVFWDKSQIRRIDSYIEEMKNDPGPELKRDQGFRLKDGARSLLYTFKDIGNLSIFRRYKQNIQADLIKAHISLKGEEFITLSLVVALASGLIFTLMLRHPFPGVIFGIIGWFLPILYVNSKKKKRMKQLNEQLGDAISLISNSLKAGFSFFQAVDTITSEMTGSISEEFAKVKKEINLGTTTEKALENLVERTESDDLELIVTAILVQRQVGGNLAEVLDNISDTIRQRVRMKGEIKTLTAQGRMSGIIIALIPPLIALAIGTINPSYMSLLFTRKIGWAMLSGSVLMELIGIYAITKIINIEV